MYETIRVPPPLLDSSLGTWSLFLISLSLVGEWGGGGAQLLLINFATRLHGIRNGSNSGMKRGAHTPSPQSWDWG